MASDLGLHCLLRPFCPSSQFSYGIDIMKTRLYNFDPLKPHFYTIKLGFTGVYIIFLFLPKNIDCGYSLEPPRYVLSRNTKNIRILSENFQFLGVKFSMYLDRRVFVMRNVFITFFPDIS